jgi:hypothetical protein
MLNLLSIQHSSVKFCTGSLTLELLGKFHFSLYWSNIAPTLQEAIFFCKKLFLIQKLST